MRFHFALTSLLLSAAAEGKGRFTYYDMPDALSGPCDLSTGPDGRVWVSDFLRPLVQAIDPNTGEIEQFEIPYTGQILNITLPGKLGELSKRAVFACVSQPGEDGNMYFASGVRNQFAKLDMKTKKMTVFDNRNTLGNLQPLNDFWRAPTGMVFSQTTANTITLFDYKTHKRRDYHPPTPQSGPVGIYYGSDKHIWFCEFVGQKIGKLNLTSGKITEFPITDPLLLGPAVTRAETKDANGRYIWFTSFLGNSIGRINMDTGEMKAFPHPVPLAFPTENTVDSKGNIWYSTATQNNLNKLVPKTGHVKIIPQPNSLLPPVGLPPAVDIAMHFGPGNDMWFTELAKNRVGRYKLRQ